MNKFLEDILEIENSNFHLDSRKVQKDDIFFAYPGETQDGRNFIDQAIKNGARIIFYEDCSSANEPMASVAIPDAVVANEPMASVAISHPRLIPIRNLKNKIPDLAKQLTKKKYPALFQNQNNIDIQITAVTGTNGKSSICHYISQLTSAISNKNTGNIGTLGCFVYSPKDINKNIKKLKSATHTTPDPFTLWEQISQLKLKHEISNLAIEASSHALIQNRLKNLPIDTAIFSNLSQDHLDYHKTMDNYFDAKLKLFTENKNLKLAIIYLDSNLSKPKLNKLINYLINNKIKYITYALSSKPLYNYSPDFYYSDLLPNKDGFKVKLNTPDNIIDLNIPLYGRFNLANILAALISSIYYLDLNPIILKKIIEKIKPLAGRMMPLKNKQVFIDYAHTPDAIEKALLAIKEHFKDKKITIVFGCGGNRDKKKRPLMTQAALKYADNLILTNDNPRDEDPNDIFYDMTKLFNRDINKSKIKIIPDRESAITFALKNKKNNEIILLAGKGHETSIKIKDKVISCDESEIVESFLW
jgi:UDP-N-acetylmuramyl-tripeptide synthetase